MNVTVQDLKTNAAEILRRAAAGEEIRVTLDGKPYVRIAPDPDRAKPIAEADRLPRIGAFQGRIWMAEDFDDLGPEWREYLVGRRDDLVV